MIRVFNARALGLAMLVVTSALMTPSSALATATLTAHVDGTTSVGLWYLGKGIGNVTGYDGNVYYNTITLYASNPGDPNPNPTITYSTNKPLLLSLSPSGATVNINAIAPSYVTLQSPPPDYNITVTATWDGVQTNPVYVFINTPYSNTVVNEGEYCSAFNACNCNALGFNGGTGYVNLFDVYARDLFDNALVQIPANETLTNPQFLGTGGWTSANLAAPKAGAWTVGAWNSTYSFPDYFDICSPNPAGYVPPPTSYNANGGTAVFTETQDYWIGSATNGSGVCTQVDYNTLYTNHGTQSGAQIPGYPGTTKCNSYYFINPRP